MKNRKFGIFIIMILLSIIVNYKCVAAKEVNLRMGEIKEKKIMNFTVSLPVLGDFKVYAKMRTEVYGNLGVDLDVNRQIISPNEDLQIYIKPISGKLAINRTVIVEVIDPKGNIHRMELPSIYETMDIPGTFSMSIPIPISYILKAVITYCTHGAGAIIPIPSISANVNAEVTTYPRLYIKAKGCYPDLTEVVLYSKKPTTVKLRKTEGVGGKIVLESWNLNSEISVSSEVFGGGKCIGNTYPPVTYKLIDKTEKINEVIATLKTPIKIDLSQIKSVHVGEKTLISGSISPPASINLKILCDNIVIAEIKSSSDGKFDYIWIPKTEGKHFVKVVHDGSEFTTPAESNIVEVSIKPPVKPKPAETSAVESPVTTTPTIGFKVLVLVGLIAIALVASLLLKR